MRIAFLGDLHFGVRSANDDFLEFQAEFVRYFLDKCVELGVDHIVQVGDFFDVRKTMNLKILHYVRTDFKRDIKKAGIPWHVFPGNHDIFLKDSNRITSLRVFDDLDPLMTVYEKPTDVKFGINTFLFLPWIDEDIATNLTKTIQDSKADYMVGHLELSGFPMYCNNVAEHGLNADVFSKFKKVWTGHYHTVSDRLNIQYIGSPYHLTWGDVPDGDNRGFFVFDSSDESNTLIKNPDWMSLFSVYVYDPTATYTVESLNKELGSKLVKFVVRSKPSEKHYRDFVKLLNRVDMIEYRIIDETTVEAKTVEIKESDLQLDTSTVFSNYIDGQPDGMFDKAQVKSLMNDVLTRAQQAQT